jgi:hypothetical protein
VVRRRGRRASDYPQTSSTLGNPESAERLALAMGIALVGELTERDRVLIIETTRIFSGRIFDLETENARLNDLILELRRLIG